MTSKSSTGRAKPLTSTAPTSRSSNSAAAPVRTRRLTRIWPGRGEVAEPGREVGHRPDRRIVPPALEADPPERRVALRDADAEAEVVAAGPPARGEPLDPLAHGDRHPDRARRGVRARRRVVEEDHEPVAGEMLQGAPEGEHELPEGRVVVPEDGHRLLGLGHLGECREAAEVGEDRRDLAPVALEEGLVAGLDDQPGDLGREEAAEPSEPFEGLDLGGHALLELPVPLFEVPGLPGDRVVQPLDPDERPDAGEQLGLVERLGHEVVGAALEGAEPLLGPARRHHDDREHGPARVGLDPEAGLVAVDPRHEDVEEDEVHVVVLLEQVERLLPRRRGQHRVPPRLEHGPHELGVLRDVVDDEDDVRVRRAGHGPDPGALPASRCARTCSGNSRTLIGFWR